MLAQRLGLSGAFYIPETANGRGVCDAARVGTIVEDVPHVGDTAHGVTGRSLEIEERREGDHWACRAERQAQEEQEPARAEASTTMLRLRHYVCPTRTG